MLEPLSSAGLERAGRQPELIRPADLPGSDLWAKRRHLLNTQDLSQQEIDCVMRLAADCKRFHELKTAPLTVLQHKCLANLFYENSTRTRSSFELAARKLGAYVLNLDIKTSSTAKGESIEDTARQLVSMGADAVVQRHSSSGSAHALVRALGDRVHVINAGDGWNAHPTQALLDLFSMLEVRSSLKGARVAIIGDITHSRVARSNIWLLQSLGVDLNICGPPALVPSALKQLPAVKIHTKLEDALRDADFIIALRLQMERQQQGLISSVGEYRKLYRLDHDRIKVASPQVRVLHPGPVNRGIEITEALIDDAEISLVHKQVTNGIAVRMAVLYLLLSGDGAAK